MNKRKRIQRATEFITGLVSLVLANVVTAFVFIYVYEAVGGYSITSWLNYAIIGLLSYLIVFLCFSSQLNMLTRSKQYEIYSCLRNNIFTYSILASLLLITKNDLIQSRYLFFGSFGLYFVFSLASRYYLKRFLRNSISNGRMASIVGIITTVKRSESFVTKLQADWSKNIAGIALIDATFEDGDYKTKKKIYVKDENGDSRRRSVLTKIDSVSGVPVKANKTNLMDWIRKQAFDEIFINLNENELPNLAEVVEELEDMGVSVHVNLVSIENIVTNSKFDNVNCVIKAGYPMAVFEPVVYSPTALMFKRFVDIIGGIVGSIVTVVLILIFAIPIKIESPGPIIFKQKRIGRNGRVFNIYKMRSMYQDAEERKKELMEQNKMSGLMFKMDNDPRITKIGKFIRKYSIDEFPQFFNVLKGDMSLVGTRPPTEEEFKAYESHHKRRLSLQPGITGLWQVSGRSDINDFDEVVKLDLEYIDNWSPWLDFKIVLKTVPVVLFHKGAE